MRSTLQREELSKMENKLLVKNQEEIKKEQAVLINNEKKIYSPISGKVVGAKDCVSGLGISHKCLVIENDFKEKLEKRKNMRKNFLKITKENFFDIICFNCSCLFL